jgi:nucleotide-binding universal stress UspA family protein
MKIITAATDFSKAAANAAVYATGMVASMCADLMLVHSWKLPVTYGEIPIPVITDNIIEDAKRNIDTLKKKLSIKSIRKINISTKIRMGDFFSKLEKICDSVKPDVVVMGSQGTTAAERAISGGHTVHAMKNLQWTLITGTAGAAFCGIKKIGLAGDFNKINHCGG